MSGCKHENIEVGVYEYCVDCGAVKRTYRPGQFVEEEWHSCPKCALAAPIADLVAGRRRSRGGEGE